MSKFGEAFKTGQSKAKDAQLARSTIKKILDEVCEEIFQASGKKLIVFVGTQPLPGMRGSVVDVSKIILPGEVFLAGSMQFLLATNTSAKDQNWIRLAQWEQSADGFPVAITASGSKVRCHNAEALEAALVDVLGSAHSGEVFSRLMEVD